MRNKSYHSADMMSSSVCSIGGSTEIRDEMREANAAESRSKVQLCKYKSSSLTNIYIEINV